MSILFESECQRIRVYNCLLGDNSLSNLGEEIREGLSATPKSIPSKCFYDARGSKLFEQICHLPEYYQTRTEISLLKQYGPRIMSSIADGDLVEMGSGANWKIRVLIDSVWEDSKGLLRYVQIDISHTALLESAEE